MLKNDLRAFLCRRADGVEAQWVANPHSITACAEQPWKWSHIMRQFGGGDARRPHTDGRGVGADAFDAFRQPQQ